MKGNPKLHSQGIQKLNKPYRELPTAKRIQNFNELMTNLTDITVHNQFYDSEKLNLLDDRLFLLEAIRQMGTNLRM